MILTKQGVGLAVQASRAAFSRGARLQDIVALVDFYLAHDGAWTSGAGALCSRVMNWTPGQNPDQHWPKQSRKYQEQLAFEEKQAQAAQYQRQASQKIKSSQEDALMLEKRHGPKLDAMSKSEIARMIDESSGGNFMKRTWRREGLQSTALRNWLMIQIDKKNKEKCNDSKTETANLDPSDSGRLDNHQKGVGQMSEADHESLPRKLDFAAS